MTLSWEVMKDVVNNGGNLIIHDTGAASWELLRELAQTAKETGAHITVSDSRISWELALELSKLLGNQFTIECGSQKK
ncbi:MAG TPA: hypothetical protein VGY56_14160 [Verrucomicrobiae bacterium]|jgi:hypothetical protein|nr:hypothetical protein [Verrucomicrobiae bacterium]